MAVQWLRLCPSITGAVGLIPSQGTKILHAVVHGQKEKIENKTKTKKQD